MVKSLSLHHHQVGGKLVIAINSPVACCLIRKLSLCLQAQLLMQGLSGKTATSESDLADISPNETILSPKAIRSRKKKAMVFFD
jgi:hypothetical protein